LDQAPFLPRNWRELISGRAQHKIIAIKTHDPPGDEAPAIYIIRDGRATLQSYYEYHQRFSFEQPSLTEVIAGACQFGSWSEHYLAWRPQSRPCTLFIRYEELVSKPSAVIPGLADFLKIVPAQGHLPTFEELKARAPEFFRRGDNRDFLGLWKPQQMALFNQLHGPVMQELGYPLVEAADSSNQSVIHLARSAARLHRLYEEQLKKLGLAAASQEQLGREVARLSQELAETSQRLAGQERLLNKRWVRFGSAIGAMPARAVGNGH
jgi:hypothetical protein